MNDFTPVVRSKTKMTARANPILARLPNGPCEMVEIGVSQALLGQHLLRSRPKMIWHGVDSWLGADMQPEAYLATNDAHAHLSREHARLHHKAAMQRLREFGDRARVYHMISRTAAMLFPEGGADLVFIDADHSYEGTLRDCFDWWPKVREGGWLGGHDFASGDPRFKFGVDTAVKEFSTRIGAEFELDGGMTWWVRRAGSAS